MKKLLVLSVIVALSIGCTGLAGVAKQLKDDSALVTVQVKTLYGSGYMVRDGRANGSTTVSMDGALTSTSNTNNNFRPTPPPAPQIQTITPDMFTQLVRQNEEFAKQILGVTNQTSLQTTNVVK